MTLQQITLRRIEALKLLRHILEIRTAVNRSFDRYYQGDYDGIEDQLLKSIKFFFILKSNTKSALQRLRRGAAVACRLAT
jgi:hypothetical protein